MNGKPRMKLLTAYFFPPPLRSHADIEEGEL